MKVAPIALASLSLVLLAGCSTSGTASVSGTAQTYAIPAEQPTTVTCAPSAGTFALLGPVLSKDPDIKFSIIESPGTADQKAFYWATVRADNPSLPENDLNQFEGGKTYVIQTSHDLVLTCGQYLEEKN